MTTPPPTSWTTLLIDLDDTVYPSSAGVWDAIADNMDRYMIEVLGIPQPEVRSLRVQLFKAYGTTLRGLQMTRPIDTPGFLKFVHDVPVERMLAPAPELRRVLNAYPQRKAIFTNADQHHARRVIRQLQVEECFDAIVDIVDIDPYCKPMPEAFAIALKKLGVSSPAECVFIDDSLRNLAGARALGFYTIRVGSDQPAPECHASILRLDDLPCVLPPEVPAQELSPYG